MRCDRLILVVMLCATLVACSADGSGGSSYGYGTGGGSGTGSGAGGIGAGGGLGGVGGAGGGLPTDCSVATTYIYVVGQFNELYRFDPKPNQLAADRHHQLSGRRKCDAVFNGRAAQRHGVGPFHGRQDLSRQHPRRELPGDQFSTEPGGISHVRHGVRQRRRGWRQRNALHRAGHGGRRRQHARQDRRGLVERAADRRLRSAANRCRAHRQRQRRALRLLQDDADQGGADRKDQRPHPGHGRAAAQRDHGGLGVRVLGGDFYLFSAQGFGSKIDRFNLQSGQTQNLNPNLGFNVVGAGVSTCAPVSVPH